MRRSRRGLWWLLGGLAVLVVGLAVLALPFRTVPGDAAAAKQALTAAKDAALAGDTELDSVGLGNVDARLRNAFGDDYGLVVETAPGAGTKVVVRVPKFAPGVHA